MSRSGWSATGTPSTRLDHRGHGRSEGPRALIDRIDRAVADIDALVSMAHGAHPELPVFMLAHSMGGTFGVQYALAHQDRLSGLILSGAAGRARRRAGAAADGRPPALGGRAPHGPDRGRPRPGQPRSPGGGGLPSRSARPPRQAAGPDGRRAGERDRRLSPPSGRRSPFPTLILYGTADGLAPPRGSQMLAERLGAADQTVIPYEGLYHEILNEPEQQTVLDDLCAVA